MKPLTLSDALTSACDQWPQRMAITAAGSSMTYAEFGAAVAALAGAYRSLGIKPGDRVVCQLGNRPEYLIAMGAAWVCGAIHVGAEHDLTPSELSWLLGRTEAAAVLIPAGGDDGGAVASGFRHEHPATRVIVAEQSRPPEGCYPLSALLGRPAGSEPLSSPSGSGPAPDDPAVIFFTSGTTGRPKGPVGQHGPLLEAWGGLGEAIGCGPEDVHLAQLPLAHGFGMMMAAIALFSGGRLVIVDRFSPSEALRLVTQERITVFNGTPTHFTLLLDRLDPASTDVSSLRAGVGSAASFPPALLRQIFDRLGMDLALLYGSSEGLSFMTTDRDEMLQGSVGKPEPGWLEIVGPDHAPVATGEIGEIAFRVWVPVRYWAEPERSRQVDEWYYSGDVGRFDADGNLYVVGRLKHQINRGGQKVDPGEIEAVLAVWPEVADAAVLAMPDPVLGEIVGACVVWDGELPLGLEELRRRLGSSLARHKLPEELCLVDTIPRTPLGKVDHDALRASLEGIPSRERLRAN